MDQYDVAYKAMLYTEDVAEERHAALVTKEIENIFGKRTYDNNMWKKLMICNQGEMRRELATTIKQWSTVKELYKKSARPRTADFGIEIVKKMQANWDEAEEKRNECFVKLGEIEREVREKNLEVWSMFLKDVADGNDDTLVDE